MLSVSMNVIIVIVKTDKNDFFAIYSTARIAYIVLVLREYNNDVSLSLMPTPRRASDYWWKKCDIFDNADRNNDCTLDAGWRAWYS